MADGSIVLEVESATGKLVVESLLLHVTPTTTTTTSTSSTTSTSTSSTSTTTA